MEERNQTADAKSDHDTATLLDLPVANEQAGRTTGGALGGRDEELGIIVGASPGASAHVK